MDSKERDVEMKKWKGVKGCAQGEDGRGNIQRSDERGTRSRRAMTRIRLGTACWCADSTAESEDESYGLRSFCRAIHSGS